nr:hypothetical protein DBT53_13070 [Aerococcus mictus]
MQRPSRNRPGHPMPKWPLPAIFHGAYIDALLKHPSGTSDNSVFEIVAGRLGPGITRDHVRRVIKSFRMRLGGLDREARALAIHAALATAGILRGFDEQQLASGAAVRGKRMPRPEC